MILICGGIGSGKSMVSAILRANGKEVYDCDSEARRLMENDEVIKRRLSEEICNDAVDESGKINRRRIAEVVFSDAAALARLNAIVHGAVKADILKKAEADKQLFVETAIPVSGGMLELEPVEVWQVEAPLELRVERVMHRNNVDADSVLARIEAQKSEYIADAVTIVNDNVTALLPQVLSRMSR